MAGRDGSLDRKKIARRGRDQHRIERATRPQAQRRRPIEALTVPAESEAVSSIALGWVPALLFIAAFTVLGGFTGGPGRPLFVLGCVAVAGFAWVWMRRMFFDENRLSIHKGVNDLKLCTKRLSGGSIARMPCTEPRRRTPGKKRSAARRSSSLVSSRLFTSAMMLSTSGAEQSAAKPDSPVPMRCSSARGKRSRI